MIPECYYRISVKGIVIDSDGRFLLSKEENCKWELLGGGLEYNENPIDGLRREIKEEAGLTISYVSPAPKYFITCQRQDKDTYIANVIYEIRLQNLDFTPSEECRELKFFSFEEAKKLDLFPNVRQLLKVYDVALHR